MTEIDTRFIETLDQLADEISSIRAKLDRLFWLRQRVQAEYDAAIDKIIQNELFTEEEAAERLRITPRQLADLRRSEGLPHVRLGRDIRYSNKNLSDIIELLDTGNIRRRLRRVS
jgi:hypothetical protein